MACGMFPNLESLQAEVKFLMADKRNLEKVIKDLREEIKELRDERDNAILLSDEEMEDFEEKTVLHDDDS